MDIESDNQELEPYKRFCDNWIAAWTRRDPQTIADFFAEDSLYRDPARSSGVRGTEEISEYLELLFATHPDWTFSLVDFWLAPGNILFIKWRISASVAGRLVEEVSMQLIELKDMRIWNCEIYYDRCDFLGIS